MEITQSAEDFTVQSYSMDISMLLEDALKITSYLEICIG